MTLVQALGLPRVRGRGHFNEPLRLVVSLRYRRPLAVGPFGPTLCPCATSSPTLWALITHDPLKRGDGRSSIGYRAKDDAADVARY